MVHVYPDNIQTSSAHLRCSKLPFREKGKQPVDIRRKAFVHLHLMSILATRQAYLRLCLAGRSCTGGKTEDFMAAAKLFHSAGQEVTVPTYLVPATQKVPSLTCLCVTLRL